MSSRCPHPLLALLAALSASLSLAACGSANPDEANLDTLDAELTNSTASQQPAKDPALMSALQSQIMVDPALAQQSNADAVRPPDQPYAAPVPADAADPSAAKPAGPLMKAPEPKADCPQCAVAEQAVTLGGLAARQRTPRTASCVGGLRYSASWAARMPADLPIYPGARLVEAAGNNANGCTLRAASFVTDASVQQVVDYYYTRTTSGGFASEHQAKNGAHVLGGNRARDDAAFVVYASTRDGGGTEVDVIANAGS